MRGEIPQSHPLVSIIIPTYRRPELLQEAVASVVRQTYENTELIVVDDHSPIPAEKTLNEINTIEKLRVIRHQTNRGANAARNTGINAATGSLIAFLDDDDRWEPEKIQHQVMRFEEGGGKVGLVYTGATEIEDNGKVRSIFTPSMSGDVTREFFRGGMIGSFSRVMVRSSVIDAAGLLDERFPSWQDREWYLRLSLHCEFDFISDPLVIQRSPSIQISDDFEQKRDISYPLFMQKHRSLASDYGPIAERQFMASLSRTLGASGLRNGYYSDALKYLIVSIRQYPFWWQTYVYLLLALGGPITYESVRRIKHGYYRHMASEFGRQEA